VDYEQRIPARCIAGGFPRVTYRAILGAPCGTNRAAPTFQMQGRKEPEMKIAVSAIVALILLGDMASARTALIARVGPQDCFLPPDVSVAVNALGPYCSSPRGPRYRVVTYHRPYHYYQPYYYYPPYYYTFFLCWNWSSC